MVSCLELKIQTLTRHVSACVDDRGGHQVVVAVQKKYFTATSE